MVASTLEEAVSVFDPREALKGESLEKYYVERYNSPINELKVRLDVYKKSKKPVKILFTGHRGSGKSTEINKLISQVKDDFFIVHYSVDEVLNISGISYVDVLLSIGVQICRTAISKEVGLKKRNVKDIHSWMRTLIKEKLIEDSASGSAEAKLDAFLLKLSSKLKTEAITRTKIREEIEPKVADLIERINIVISEIELKTGKDVLVIIDDLDKPDIKTARELFYEHSASLTLPNCKIIYTIPIALAYSTDCRQIDQSFDDKKILPNIKVHKRDNSPDDKCIKELKKVISTRMSVDLIEADALELIIEMSGGILRELVRLVQSSCIKSISGGDSKITKKVVEEVVSELRNDYRRIIKEKHFEKLKEIYETKELKKAEELLELLHNLSVLEYKNTEGWCDVHPIVVSLLKEKGKLK